MNKFIFNTTVLCVSLFTCGTVIGTFDTMLGEIFSIMGAFVGLLDIVALMVIKAMKEMEGDRNEEW